MRRKDLLQIFLITLIATITVTIPTPTATAQQKATVAVSPLVIDTRNLKQIDDTFSINITIANVKKLWGYQYSLFYNTSVINAISYTKLDDRFQEDLGSEIGINYVAVARGTYYADPDGITTVAPIPVDSIDFVVTGNGTTTLAFDPEYTALSNIPSPIITFVVDGRFSNTQILGTHDVAVTQASVSTTTAAPGDKITINAVVTNNGDFPENITVTASYNETKTIQKQIGTPQTITNLQNGSSSQTLSFTWVTTGVAQGKYAVTVEATIPIDDVISDNTRITDTVTLTTGGGEGLPTVIIYIAAGIIIIVIVVVAVYALRARKSK